MGESLILTSRVVELGNIEDVTLSKSTKSCGNGDGMQMIGLSVHFVKHKTSLLPRGMTINKYSEVNGQVSVNHNYIVKKMKIKYLSMVV